MMRRDWNVIRTILQTIDRELHARCEDCGTDYWTFETQLELMRQGGLIRSTNEEHRRRHGFIQPCNLTWLGEEFLAECSDAEIWDAVQDAIRTKGVTPSFGVLRRLLQKQMLEKCLEGSDGI